MRANHVWSRCQWQKPEIIDAIAIPKDARRHHCCVCEMEPGQWNVEAGDPGTRGVDYVVCDICYGERLLNWIEEERKIDFGNHVDDLNDDRWLEAHHANH